MSPDLLNLPWQIQLSLASGYAAYLLSYVGIRSHHKTIEITFSTLIFGLVATLTYGGLNVTLGVVWSSIVAFLLACCVGLLWRKFGRVWLAKAIRWSDISWSDDDPSSLATLLSDTKNDVSQIAVLTEEGTWLECEDTSRFANSPFGPCRIGPNGDVALYLTHIKSKGEEPEEIQSVLDKDYGDRITYVPSGKIQRITFRHKRKPLLVSRWRRFLDGRRLARGSRSLSS